MPVRVPLSVLDLAPVTEGRTVGEALAETVQVARTAEALGYDRVWYAEHHNFPSIASSATAVLIAHVAAHTTTIRLGAGGIMLPNHAPLIIAEQFGTLASLHPGRIDLGLGRAPGTDQNTTLALRRDPRAAETFPEDVAELRGFLSGDTRIAGVHQRRGREVRRERVRERFTPSAQLERPYVIAAVNVLAADTDAEARRQLEVRRREIGRTILSPPGRRLADDEVDRALRSPQGRHVERMFTYLALGTRDAVAAYMDDFRAHADADELITVHGADTVEGRLRSLELVAETADAAAA